MILILAFYEQTILDNARHNWGERWPSKREMYDRLGLTYLFDEKTNIGNINAG